MEDEPTTRITRASREGRRAMARTAQQLSDMYQDATRWRLFQEWAAAEQRAEDAESALAESGRRNVDMINRRVPIEQVLLDAANGKCPLPTAEDCRSLAMRLGSPEG
jgi:hypothetical protein